MAGAPAELSLHTSAAAMWLPSSSAVMALRRLPPDAARARLPAPALLLPSTAAAAAAASCPANTLGSPDRRCLLDSLRCFSGLRERQRRTDMRVQPWILDKVWKHAEN